MSVKVTNQDLADLLTILYQGSVRKNPLSLEPVYNTGAQFFLMDDLPTLAAEYDLPLPSAGIEATLKVGLKQGLYQRSIQNGTQCGSNVCHPQGASYRSFYSAGSGYVNPNRNVNLSINNDTNSSPVLIYAYNPRLLQLNSQNLAVLNAQNTCPGHVCQSYQQVAGSFVKYSNNRAPFYQDRGWGFTSKNPGFRTGNTASNACCRH